MAKFKISLAFVRAKHTPLNLFANSVGKMMAGNPHFIMPAIDLTVLATANDVFEQSITAAKFGGQMATAAKMQARLALIELLREQAAYVQFTVKGDEVMALSSGFLVTKRNTAQSELAVPRIKSFSNPASGVMGMRLTPVRNARVYEVWLRIGDGDWKLAQSFRSTQQMQLTGLTPGALYEIRVRAVGGKTGYSGWSDSVFHRST